MTGSVIIDSGMLSCGDNSPPLLAGGGEEESFPLLRIDSSPPGGAGGPHDEEGSLDDLIAGYLAEEPLSLGLRGERGAAPPLPATLYTDIQCAMSRPLRYYRGRDLSNRETTLDDGFFEIPPKPRRALERSRRGRSQAG
jgi:hypothetical protein